MPILKKNPIPMNFCVVDAKIFYLCPSSILCLANTVGTEFWREIMAYSMEGTQLELSRQADLQTERGHKFLLCTYNMFFVV